MGFSISAATALIFASLFLAFGIFYPAMANGYERVEDADAAKADHDLEQAQTDINITNVDLKTAGGGGNPRIQTIKVNITNTGTTALTANETDFLLGGAYIKREVYDDPGASKIKVDGDANTNLWLPDEELFIKYKPDNNEDEAKSFKITTEHGVSDRRELNY